MGVLRCHRNGCDNIMCDRYSREHGYLCQSCFEELVDCGPQQDVGEFMETKPRPGRREAARARFNVEFPSRDNT